MRGKHHLTASPSTSPSLTLQTPFSAPFTRPTPVFPADKADDITGPIKYDVTENTVHITWQEPLAPNGMIILYEVNYKRHGDTEVKTRNICQTHQSCFLSGSICSDDGQGPKYTASLSVLLTTTTPHPQKNKTKKTKDISAINNLF